MLVTGLTYRVLAGHLWSPVTKPPIAPAALDRLPLEMGDWIGQDVPVDPRVMRAAGTDAVVSRQYSKRGGIQAVSLYIGAGVRVADVLVHNPPACYVAAGWSVVDRHSGELPSRDDASVPYTILNLSRSGSDRSKLIILHYIVLDDRVFPDMRAVQRAVRPGFRAVDVAATVQILASGEDLLPDLGAPLVATFATDSAAAIQQLFEDLLRDRREMTSGHPVTME
ncbi:MAG: exosortase-associated EpsI family protein [Planctomycetota bacterium]|nr:exosortase-associated EpsI family protein [Planctomycetota bacterium]